MQNLGIININNVLEFLQSFKISLSFGQASSMKRIQAECLILSETKYTGFWGHKNTVGQPNLPKSNLLL